MVAGGRARQVNCTSGFHAANCRYLAELTPCGHGNAEYSGFRPWVVLLLPIEIYLCTHFLSLLGRSHTPCLTSCSYIRTCRGQMWHHPNNSQIHSLLCQRVQCTSKIFQPTALYSLSFLEPMILSLWLLYYGIHRMHACFTCSSDYLCICYLRQFTTKY